LGSFLKNDLAAEKCEKDLTKLYAARTALAEKSNAHQLSEK
jgi:hypothetical protein